MAARALLDTSVCIEIERGRLSFEVLATVLAGAAPALAAVTVSEMLVGAHLADTDGRRRHREDALEQLLAVADVMAFDVPAAREYGRLLADLRRSGINLGAHDLQIAATALAHQCPVVTVNRRDFDRIPGLLLHVVPAAAG